MPLSATTSTDGAPSRPTLYGYDASTYTQIVRLALAEKEVDYDYRPVADWSGYHKRPKFEGLHPFAKVPVFDHGGVRLYETAAILRYIDAAFDRPALQPHTPAELARMQQVISVYDNYAFRPWVSVIAGERLFVQLTGATADEAAIEAAGADATRAAAALDALLRGKPADRIDLADLYLVPALGYLEQTPEGQAILTDFPALAARWRLLRNRRSVREILSSVTRNLGTTRSCQASP